MLAGAFWGGGESDVPPSPPPLAWCAAEASRAESARALQRETDGAGLQHEEADDDDDPGDEGEDEGVGDVDADAADGTGGGGVAGIRPDGSDGAAEADADAGGETRSASKWVKPVCFACGALSSALPVHVLLGGACDEDGRDEPKCPGACAVRMQWYRAASAKLRAAGYGSTLDATAARSYERLAVLLGARRGTKRWLSRALTKIFANHWGEYSAIKLESARAFQAELAGAGA